MEDKQKILDLLLPALQATRNLADLVGREYREDRELVYAKFASGNQKIVNVAIGYHTDSRADQAVVRTGKIKMSAHKSRQA